MYNKKWWAENKERVNAQRRDIYKEQNVEMREKRRLYKLKNKDKISAATKRHYARHKNSILKRSREWYEKNKAHKLRVAKLWREHNKIRSNSYSAKRRAVLLTTDITSDFLENLWGSTKFCVLCGVSLEDNSKYPNGKELDHIKPICIGGLHNQDNVRYICVKCNRKRPKDGSDL